MRALLLLALALPAYADCPDPPPVVAPPAGPIVCQGFAATEVLDLPIPASRSPLPSGETQPIKRFSKSVTGDKALVVRFKAPASGLLQINITGIVGTEQVQRLPKLSSAPCDFDGAMANSHPTYRMSAVLGQQRITYAPGKTYYINVGHVVRSGPANVIVTVTNL